MTAGDSSRHNPTLGRAGRTAHTSGLSPLGSSRSRQPIFNRGGLLKKSAHGLGHGAIFGLGQILDNATQGWRNFGPDDRVRRLLFVFFILHGAYTTSIRYTLSIGSMKFLWLN